MAWHDYTHIFLLQSVYVTYLYHILPMVMQLYNSISIQGLLLI